MLLFQIFYLNRQLMHASHVINYKIQNLQIVLKMLKKLRSGTTL